MAGDACGLGVRGKGKTGRKELPVVTSVKAPRYRNEAAIVRTLDDYVRVCYHLMQEHRREAAACTRYSIEWIEARQMAHLHRQSLMALIRVRRAGRRGF